MTSDPTNKYPEAPENAFIEACGLLTPWIIEGIENKEHDMWKHLEDSYGFGMFEIEQVKISDEGIWSYPGDEDLHPLMTFEGNNINVHIYEYGMVAIKESNSNDFKCTRMD